MKICIVRLTKYISFLVQRNCVFNFGQGFLYETFSRLIIRLWSFDTFNPLTTSVPIIKKPVS